MIPEIKKGDILSPFLLDMISLLIKWLAETHVVKAH